MSLWSQVWVGRALKISRRKAELLIREGKVYYNSRLVVLGEKIPLNASLLIDHQPWVLVESQPKIIAYHKPKFELCTVSDDRGRKTVCDRFSEHLIPIGRLDYETTGLLLLTNHGPWVHSIIHPSQHIDKVYEVSFDQSYKKNFNSGRLLIGFEADDGLLKIDEIYKIRENNHIITVTLKISYGKNRMIRRLFEYLSIPSIDLKRISIGPIELNELEVGQWRELSLKEQDLLIK